MTSSNGFAKTMLHFFSETTISSFSGRAPSVLAMAFRLKPAQVQRTADGIDVTAAYAIGAVAAYWLIARTSAFFV